MVNIGRRFVFRELKHRILETPYKDFKFYRVEDEDGWIIHLPQETVENIFKDNKMSEVRENFILDFLDSLEPKYIVGKKLKHLKNHMDTFSNLHSYSYAASTPELAQILKQEGYIVEKGIIMVKRKEDNDEI